MRQKGPNRLATDGRNCPGLASACMYARLEHGPDVTHLNHQQAAPLSVRQQTSERPDHIRAWLCTQAGWLISSCCPPCWLCSIPGWRLQSVRKTDTIEVLGASCCDGCRYPESSRSP